MIRVKGDCKRNIEQKEQATYKLGMSASPAPLMTPIVIWRNMLYTEIVIPLLLTMYNFNNVYTMYKRVDILNVYI
jgi:hypothetical protein